MRVLVTGAGGFVGGHVAAALRTAGHEVLHGLRRPRPGFDPVFICDLTRASEAEWAPQLGGIDVIVNCAGILRERGADSFERVHYAGPMALFRAAGQAGVRRVIQISALGDPQDDPCIASKHHCDATLSALRVDWVVLRPSLVYSPRGSRGPGSLLRALAALPWIVPLPGGGRQRVQPVCAEDLARVVVALADSGRCSRQVLECAGPEPLSLRAFVYALRDWLGIGRGWALPVPLPALFAAAWLRERLARGPLGLTLYRTLRRDTVAAPDSTAPLRKLLGGEPRSVVQVLGAVPSQTQDRQHARLYFLAPLLRLSLALVWLGSALVGFLTPLEESAALLAPAAGLAAEWQAPLVYATSGLNAILGGLLLLGLWTRLVAALMFVSLLLCTVLAGVALPSAWLEPFGGLLKNLALLPAVLLLLALERQR